MTRCKKVLFLCLSFITLFILNFTVITSAYAEDYNDYYYRTDLGYLFPYGEPYTFQIDMPYDVIYRHNVSLQSSHYTIGYYPIKVTTDFYTWEFSTILNYSNGEFQANSYKFSYVYLDRDIPMDATSFTLFLSDNLDFTHTGYFRLGTYYDYNFETSAVISTDTYFKDIVTYVNSHRDYNNRVVSFYYNYGVKDVMYVPASVFTLTVVITDDGVDNYFIVPFVINNPTLPSSANRTFISISSLKPADYDYDTSVYGGIFEIDNLTYVDGYNRGMSDTSRDYYTDGYKDGYKKATEEVGAFNFYTLFYAMFDGVLHVFYSLFDFTFMGVNMLDFVKGIITFAVVFMLVKLFVGGKGSD